MKKREEKVDLSLEASFMAEEAGRVWASHMYPGSDAEALVEKRLRDVVRRLKLEWEAGLKRKNKRQREFARATNR